MLRTAGKVSRALTLLQWLLPVATGRTVPNVIEQDRATIC